MADTAIRESQRVASRYAEDFADYMKSWTIDHHAAMKCRDYEERLVVLNGLIRLFLGFKNNYESSIIPGEFEYDPDLEFYVEDAFERLSASCRRIDDSIRALEKQGYIVDGAQEFRSCRTIIEGHVQEARRIKSVERRMGFRGVTMDSQDVVMFRALIDARGEKSAEPSSTSPTE